VLPPDILLQFPSWKPHKGETVNKITITISCLMEDETPEHSERVTGSAPGYAEAVREVMKTAEGRWGWCSVLVKATAERGSRSVDKEGRSYLGNCSYQNAEDFALHSGYLPQMVEEAIKDMLPKLVVPCPTCNK